MRYLGQRTYVREEKRREEMVGFVGWGWGFRSDGTGRVTVMGLVWFEEGWVRVARCCVSGFGLGAYYRDMQVWKRGRGEGEKRKEGGSSGCMYEVGKGGWGCLDMQTHIVERMYVGGRIGRDTTTVIGSVYGNRAVVCICVWKRSGARESILLRLIEAILVSGSDRLPQLYGRK